MAKRTLENSRAGKLRWALALAALACGALTVSVRLKAQGQVFSSKSDGSDGALNITAPGVTYLDPVAMKINPSGSNIFNFTTINIASGSALKISEAKVHGPVYFLAQGDVTISGAIDITGDDSPGPTPTAAEQTLSFAGSGGYSGGVGGIHGDPNHKALPGNGPGGGAAGDINTAPPVGSGATFSDNRFLVPLIGGSGGGGVNGNSQFGSQGGAGGGALMIASSTTIKIGGDNVAVGTRGVYDGRIEAYGGSGGGQGCGGGGGAVRLIANSIVGINTYYIQVDAGGSWASGCAASPGLVRLEANSSTYNVGYVSGAAPITSVPFAVNLPTVAPPVITVASINGVAINANPFSFPDATINSGSSVPVVINATNVPTASSVTLYLLSDVQPNQAISVTLTGSNQSSTATVPVIFPPGGSRGFVKAVFH